MLAASVGVAGNECGDGDGSNRHGETAAGGARAAVCERAVGQPGGRPPGARNRKSLAAAILLDSEAEALTRRAVEFALAGDPTALRLCIERILPPARDRAVKFILPPIESAADVAVAMKAVAEALADGVIAPGEGEAIARMVDTFVRTIETSDFERRLAEIERANAADRDRRFAHAVNLFNPNAELAVNSLYSERRLKPKET